MDRLPESGTNLLVTADFYGYGPRRNGEISIVQLFAGDCVIVVAHPGQSPGKFAGFSDVLARHGVIEVPSAVLLTNCKRM